MGKAKRAGGSGAKESTNEGAAGEGVGLRSSRWALILLCVAVSGCVLAAHWPVLSCRAICFDDTQFVLKNDLVQNPSWTSAGRFMAEIFEPSTVGGYYLPVTMISLMLDCAAGGSPDHLLAFHRTNLVLHLINTCLIVVLVYVLFGRAWPAGLVGLLFGLHPLTVESVAWMGERKTLLAAFFSLVCLILYVRYTRRSSRWMLGGALAMYVLAILSKPTATPLPLLALLLDVWPLGRIGRKAILEKMAFYGVGAASVVTTLISHGRTAEVGLPVDQSIWQTPLLVCHNIVFYAGKMVWPVNLSSAYPVPEPLSMAHPMVGAGVLGTCLLVVLAVVSWRWGRGLMVGGLFFLAAIFPALGFVRFSWVFASDKYVYLPAVGLLLPLAWGLGWVWQRSGKVGRVALGRWAMVVSVGILAVGEARLTRRYLESWRDTETLFRHMLAVAPRAPMVHDNLGNALAQQGRMDEALEHYREAIRFNPTFPYAYYHMGQVFMSQGKLQAAGASYKKALRHKADYALAHTELGNTLTALGLLEEALSHHGQALRLRPGDAHAHLGYAVTLAKSGAFDPAKEQLSQAIALRPRWLEPRKKLAGLMLAGGELQLAVAQYEATLRMFPEDVDLLNNLAIAQSRQGQAEKAIKLFRRAVEAQPDRAQLRHNLADALTRHGELKEAATVYGQALRLDGDMVRTYLSLGKVLQRLGRVDEAVEAFREALKVDPQNEEARSRIKAMANTRAGSESD